MTSNTKITWESRWQRSVILKSNLDFAEFKRSIQRWSLGSGWRLVQGTRRRTAQKWRRSAPGGSEQRPCGKRGAGTTVDGAAVAAVGARRCRAGGRAWGVVRIVQDQAWRLARTSPAATGRDGDGAVIGVRRACIRGHTASVTWSEEKKEIMDREQEVRLGTFAFFFSVEGWSRRGLLVCSHQRCNRFQPLDISIEGLGLVGWDALALLK
jgi:hypothetical protein